MSSATAGRDAGYYDVFYTVRGSSYRFDEFNTVWGDTPEAAKTKAIAEAKRIYGEVSVYVTRVEVTKDECD